MRLLSPAKINLFLYVTGKRGDGYHTIETLMCRIRLFDVVTLSFGEGKISVSCDHPGVPPDAGNLAFRAASLFFEALDRQGIEHRESVAISIQKRIPVGAGLGGGSSNAATVLLGLNRHFGYPCSQESLMSIGASLGADVPFFIFGKPALAQGIGTTLEPAPPITPFGVVLVYPGTPLSTASVYKNLNLGLTNSEKINRKTFFNGDTLDSVGRLHNDLEPAAMSICQDIRPAKEALLACGADGALMSGSGSSVFGVFFDSNRADAAKTALRRQYGYRHIFKAGAIV